VFVSKQGQDSLGKNSSLRTTYLKSHLNFIIFERSNCLEQILAPSITNAFREFHYETGVTPFSDSTTCLSLCFAYLASIFLIRRYMQNHQPWNLYHFRIFHNALLCTASFVMVVGILSQVAITYSEGGLDSVLCDENRLQLKTNIYFWFYIFFLSKFYEFVDTYILLLRKKPITFLHCFHHFITGFVCYIGLTGEFSIQWVVIGLNGGVHVLMYYYYLAQTLGKDVWWKKHLTMVQIFQFVLDLLSMTLWLVMKLGRDCSGDLPSMIFAEGVLLSFLVLFINFYFKSYTGKKIE